MTQPGPPDSARHGPLEEVLGEYMQRLDRGEVVDREDLLARHPELAEELRSYFVASDEVERLRRQGKEGPGAPLTPNPSPPRGEGREEAPRPWGERGWGEGETQAAPGTAPRVGDYELLELIGRGGMGLIYRARQLSLQRVVALKMMRTGEPPLPADVLRFRSEAEAVASLDHPHIVPIYEVGEHEGRPFFSMKLIEGGSLAGHLPRLAGDLRAGAGLLAAAARAVHYAHQRGLLHRDLKPANILLDGEGQPHVTDFGLAKRLGPKSGDATSTQRGLIVGTPTYMAPEQAANKGVSTAADVYSLGAILYELLTGQPPFRAENPLVLLFHVLEQEPTPPRSLNQRVDRDLETVCLKCLQKEPPKRYPSAEALADDLDRWLRGEPIQARPVSRRERVLKWARRRPHLAALVALLALTLVAGFAGVCWQWRRAEGEYHKAAAHADSERRATYARAIPLAYAEWRFGNSGTAEQVLNACRPELRGWEWHYLRRLFRVRQLATREGHADGVLAVAFDPGGTRVASAGSDGVVKVWDRRALREILTLPAHSAAVTAVAFSPDGKYLASGSADGAVRVWDAARGDRLAVRSGPAGGVTGLAFDPAPPAAPGLPAWRLACTGGKPFRGELTLWGPAEEKALARKTWQHLLAAVAFSPDGRSLATAGHDGAVTVWDPTALEESLRTFQGQTERIVPWASVAYSGDGRWVAAGSPAGLVRVWDAATGEEFFSTATANQAGVSGVAFSGEGGRILAAATADNMVQGWFTRSGQPAFSLRGHTRAVKAVACSSDGECLASGGLDGMVTLWDIDRRDDDLTLRGLRGAQAGVTGVAFSPDGARLASATRDRTLQVWDVATAKTILTLQRLPAAVNGLAFGSEGQVAGGCEDGSVRIWEVPSGRERLCLRPASGPACGRLADWPNAPVHAVAFGPNGALAAAGGDGAVRVWEIPSGRERLCLRGGAPAAAVAFSPDGGRLAAAGGDGSRVWEAATGRELLALAGPVQAERPGRGLHGSRGPVHAIAFSPDGTYLATASQDEAVRVWDAATGELVRTLRGHAGAVRGLAYGRGGRLASAGDDKAVRVWDAAGQELLALRGHTEPLRALAFSPDGHRLASASDDGTIKIWDGTP